MSDETIKAALDAGADALNSPLPPKNVPFTPANLRRHNAAAAIAACLLRAADVHANAYATMEPREVLKYLAAAIERAAKEST